MPETSLYFIQWLTLIAVFTVAVIAPGPDFVMAVRNSVVYSRRAGIFTAFGFGMSILIHVSYTVLGIAAIIAQSIFVFNLIKWAGASYLVYMGVQALRSNGMGQKAVNAALQSENNENKMSDLSAFRSGLLTNLLNPKATLFFLAIFSQIINVSTPVIWLVVYGFTCATIITAWFSLVALVLNHKSVRNSFLNASKWIDRSCGLLLIALGVKVALTAR